MYRWQFACFITFFFSRLWLYFVLLIIVILFACMRFGMKHDNSTQCPSLLFVMSGIYGLPVNISDDPIYSFSECSANYLSAYTKRLVHVQKWSTFNCHLWEKICLKICYLQKQVICWGIFLIACYGRIFFKIRKSLKI